MPFFSITFCRIQRPSISKGHFSDPFPAKQEKTCALRTKFVSMHKLYDKLLFNITSDFTFMSLIDDTRQTAVYQDSLCIFLQA